MEHHDMGGNSGDQEIMLRFELEAAEALAGLAHSAMLQEENNHDDEDDDEEEEDDYSMTQPCNAFDLKPQDDDGAIVVILQEDQTEKKTISIPVKLDDESHHHQQQLCRSTSYNTMSVGGGNSRQPLSETEKEARRMRRVLANRESARQTIRRRQAIFEELTRKASDLALENENLTREKELAAKEYDSLQNTNDSLKEQMAQMMATEAGEIENVANPIDTECPASASTSTTFFPPYDQPFSLVPLHCHSIVQPLDATILQCRSQNDNAHSSVFPMTQTWRSNLFTDQRNSNTIPNSGSLLYVLPLPCFFPLHSPPNAATPRSSNSIDRQNDTHLSNQCSCTGSPCGSSLPLKIRRETYSPTITILAEDHHHAGLGIPPESRHKSEGTHPNRTALRSTPLNCFRPSSSSSGGRINVTLQQEDSSEEDVFPVTGHTANPVLEENQEPAAHSNRNPVNAGTAAEARRTRRELMKLKGN